MTEEALSTVDVDKVVSDDLPSAVDAIRFDKCDDFTTFSAEYAFIKDDIVVHFYLTPEVAARKDAKTYWKNIFPAALETTAIDFYKSGPSRLQAAYTEEVDSWWFRANGFATSLDPVSHLHKLFEKLDQALETTKVT